MAPPHDRHGLEPVPPARSGPRNILVTGGAGFVGSHLVDSLLATRDAVTVLDDLSGSPGDNLERATTNPKCLIIQGSVADPMAVDDAVARCDAVVHLAAVVGRARILESPHKCFYINTVGTKVILDAAARHRKRVIVACPATSRAPIPADVLEGITPPADEARIHGAVDLRETLANEYRVTRGAEVVVARLFNPAGPRQQAMRGMVIPRMVLQALRGETLTVYGNGRQTRCFTHVADVVKALELMLDSRAAAGQCFDVGTTVQTSISDLARRIRTLTDSRVGISPGSSPGRTDPDLGVRSESVEISRPKPDPALARDLLHWVPDRTLDEIISDTAAFVRLSGGIDPAGGRPRTRLVSLPAQVAAIQRHGDRLPS